MCADTLIVTTFIFQIQGNTSGISLTMHYVIQNIRYLINNILHLVTRVIVYK